MWLLSGHLCLAGKRSEAAALLQLCGPCCLGRVQPHSKPSASISLPSPASLSASGSIGSFMQTLFIPPHVMSCSAESRKQVCRVVMTLCPGATNPDPYGDRGPATGVHHLEEAVSEECFYHVWRRKTIVSAGGQKQQPGEEEFIKKKLKRRKVCLCKGRASGKPSCNPQPHRVGAGAMPTQLLAHPAISSAGLSWHLGTLLPPLSGLPGLQQRGFTKLDVFTCPQHHHLLLGLGHSGSSGPWSKWAVFQSPRHHRGHTPLLLMAPQLSIPSGMQTSKFPAKQLERTSKGFTVSNLSIS